MEKEKLSGLVIVKRSKECGETIKDMESVSFYDVSIFLCSGIGIH